jgi:hypothetical protein
MEGLARDIEAVKVEKKKILLESVGYKQEVEDI